MTDFVTKDSGNRVVFQSGMHRDVTTGKTRWDLVADGPMLKRWAELMTRGAVKYDARNWMKAESQEELDRAKESAFRHFMQWYLGETDEDHGAATIFGINLAEYVKEKLAAKPMAAKPSMFDLDALPDAPRQSLAEVLEEAARTYPANGVGSQYTPDGGDMHEVRPW